MKNNILFATQIGSHMWNMQTEKSDTDIFVAYVAPTDEILKGTADYKSKFTQTLNMDISQHEIGKIIEQLLKGNINFILGVMSFLSIKTNENHLQLRKIVRETIAKNCYYSIHGMAQSNYKKYIETKLNSSTKKCNQIIRVLKFGQRILNDGKISFDSVVDGTPEMILQEKDKLTFAFNNSSLPNTPDEKLYRDWLYNVRLQNGGFLVLK